MSQLLKILHLEDLPDDAQMVARVLKKAGVQCEIFHAEHKDDFIKALDEFKPGLILSDHSLPSFDSHEALNIVKDRGLEIPFILVTATVSEEYAVSIIKDGASDYILKDRLQRLPSAIANAMDKHSMALARRQTNEAIYASERKYKLLFESNPMPMWMLSRSTLDIIAVNQAAINHYGYSREEFLQLNAIKLRPAEDIGQFLTHLAKGDSNRDRPRSWRHKKKDGTIIMVDIIAHDILYEGQPARLVLANDVTEQLLAETELASQRMQQQKLITETSIQVQEREREEIGKELHDNINQLLASSKLYLQHAVKKDKLQSELLQKCEEHISLAIEEIRKLSHTLVAPSLGKITLTEAIEELIHLVTVVSPLGVQLNTAGYNEIVGDENITLTLYRIVQEQVNNIIKHAGAKNVTIELATPPGFIVLIIKDDGIGFDCNKISEGIGLRNIGNRVGFYDGASRVISAPGEGCTLEVRIPRRERGA